MPRMTKQQAVEDFRENILPAIKSEYEQDGLCKDRLITTWQYENWSHPPFCGR